MDPLSITVGALTLVEFGLKLIKSLEILRDLSHVPNDIAALIDELRDLQDVLAAVCVATKERSSIEGPRGGSHELRSLLSKTGGIFSSIASHCGIAESHRRSSNQEDPTADAESPSNVDLLTRFRWLKDRKKIDRYRVRLQILRADIGNHLASLSLVDSQSVLGELRDLAAALRQLSTNHATLHATIVQAGSPVTHQSVVDEADGLSSPVSGRPASHDSSTAILRLATDLNGIVPSLSPCSCSCHKLSKVRTPDFAETVIGSFAIHLGGIPMLTPACDELVCRRSMQYSIRTSYRFPSWLSRSSLHAMVYGSHALGPQLSVASIRTIARNSDIFCLAMQGDISGIKNLFSKGLASPFDATHNFGYTALHYATDYGHYELCTFLLMAGAKGQIQDFAGRTSTDIAYQKLCAPSFDKTSAEHLRGLFDRESWLEEKQFTNLHKIVLQLTNPKRPLADELLISTKEINAADSDGRTPISWAVKHNDTVAASVLLSFGADVGKADHDGNTPLHYACSCEGGPEVLPTLLAAGADPKARNKYGQTPLNWASFYQNDPTFVELLLHCSGVDLSETDDTGNSALGNAAFRSNEKMLSYLLDACADISSPVDESMMALMDCISTNNHASLAVLLEKSSVCNLNVAQADERGDSCLHYLARRGDLETVWIFRRALEDALVNPSTLNIETAGHDGLTVRDLLSLRGDQGMKEAMMPVLQFIQHHIEVENEGAIQDPSMDEILYWDAQESVPPHETEVDPRREQEVVHLVELT